MSGAAFGLNGPGSDRDRLGGWFNVGVLRAVAPALALGLRTTAAVCLSLWVTFELQLSAPYWAATSASLVCLPVLGASLRKSEARLIGTVVGAVFIVALTGIFPQNRVGFLLSLAAWCAVCAFVTTLLDNFASYGAALSGYTAVIIAAGATENPDQIFSLAISRTSEIVIGIVCATVVLIATTRPRSAEKLADLLAGVIAETARDTFITLRTGGPDAADSRPARRALIKRTVAARQQADEAIGESSELKSRQSTLHAALEGVFEALSDWRAIAGHMRRLPDADARRQAQEVLDTMPPDLAQLLASGDAAEWTDDPAAMRDACAYAARALVALDTRDPSVRLLASSLAEWLRAMARAANGLALLLAPGTARDAAHHWPGPGGKDLLPALVNGVRVFLTIGAVELLWIITAWPSGMTAVTFAAINVILISPKNEQAPAAATYAVIGVAGAGALAGVTKFALLPPQQTFFGLCATLTFLLVPFGAFSAIPRLTPIFSQMTLNFMPLLGLTNEMTYDPPAFYNQVLGILTGCIATAIALQVVPPVRPRVRADRLLAATWNELRDLAGKPEILPRSAWEARIYNRLAALPEEAEPIQAGRMVAVLSVGTEIIRLRQIAERFGLQSDVRGFLSEMARGNDPGAIEVLRQLDTELAAIPREVPGEEVRLRARASLQALTEALETHMASYAPEDRP